jgi:hypothetical protein
MDFFDAAGPEFGNLAALTAPTHTWVWRKLLMAVSTEPRINAAATILARP